MIGNLLLPFCLANLKKPSINEYFFNARAMQTADQTVCCVTYNGFVRHLYFSFARLRDISMFHET